MQSYAQGEKDLYSTVIIRRLFLNSILTSNMFFVCFFQHRAAVVITEGITVNVTAVVSPPDLLVETLGLHPLTPTTLSYTYGTPYSRDNCIVLPLYTYI